MQYHAQLAEQTTVMAMSGIGQVAEVTRLACGVAEAAIAEANSVHSQVKSRVESLAKDVEEMMSLTVGAMAQQLEHELEIVVVGTITMSVQNTYTAIDHLHTELPAKFDKDHAQLQQEQLNTQGRMNEISANIE